MQVNVRFLDNLKLEASFDDFSIIADQPIRYKGDGSAPGPFDYFLASSALCAAYFIKVYCKARDIPTQDIKLSQDNIVDPENRYHQNLNFKVEVPNNISEKDKEGIKKAVERCTVKRVIQNSPEFNIDVFNSSDASIDLDFKTYTHEDFKTKIIGKDSPLEETITKMRKLLSDLGIKIEIASWRNPVPYVWSVHIRDADSPVCFTNGKGSSKEAALCSALGEYLERISNNYFYNDYYLGSEIAHASFVHYPDEKWFQPEPDLSLPAGLMDPYLKKVYGMDGELNAHHLIDTNSANTQRGICALPFKRYSDGKTVYIPANLIGNLFVSNGMSAGNNLMEARVQCLSEIFERAVKNQIITEEITLPDIPMEVLQKYPHILEGIKALEDQGFHILTKDASLGGKFPVISVTLMNPRTGGVFASFGAHPKFEVALERSLTELMQGRSFEGMNEMPAPTFNQFAVQEHNNIVDHFIDSTGVVSWKFFKDQADFEFCEWNFAGSTQEEFNYLMNILEELGKEVYIADYEDLGGSACRIIVPNYSEIYQVEDLIWDNNNKALNYREDILNIHRLNDEQLTHLLDKFENTDLDDYMPVSELIGIAFDENSVWGLLTIGELKCLSLLALKRYEDAKEYVEQFFTFNDSSTERRKFYQLLNILLDIEINPDLSLDDYRSNLTKMYGSKLLELTEKTVTGEIRFYGLTETNLQFKGLDKHLKLIESYQKLRTKRDNSI